MDYGRIAVLYTRLNAQACNFRDYRPPLPAPFAERVYSMRDAKQQARTLAGYWLLERGASLAGLGVVDLRRLGRSVHGRPEIAGGPYFSISHCSDTVVCALLSGCEAGVDVERVRPVDVQKLQRFLAPGNPTDTDTSPASFFRAWTAREAVVKATGQVGLARIAKVQLQPQNDQAHLHGEPFYLNYPALGNDLVACVACRLYPAQIWTQFIPAPNPSAA